MRIASKLFMAAAVLACLASPTLADWNVGDPHKMHFPQMPDLDFGMDVLAMTPYPGDPDIGKVVADDWRCTSSGPVTDIHIWGSWLNDEFPHDPAGLPDPGAVTFRLSIHSDIAATPTTYSRPGDLLREFVFQPGSFQWREWGLASEAFFDPNQNEIIGSDTQVIQYNFFFDPTEAFRQEQGAIYWLDVSATVSPGDSAVFGWKTSQDRFNDDSVYADYVPGQPIDPGQWIEMFDPRTGESLHQAFVITPEPGTFVLLAIGTAAGGFVCLIRRRKRQQ